ncbi:MAG: cobalamin-dependent protein, partial [Candidatus Dadabacteria bacterium]|nr:cobalamin-dependent protein [Candidatus Dadabacteria bacterium]
MKILLINPNRFKSPPVPPIGLEYVASSLEERGHGTAVLDLCFSEDVFADIDREIGSFRPDITGITVRNIDTVLFHTNEFFLDDIRTLVDYIKSTHGLKVIIGGAGVAAFPEGVADYLNADYAVCGPGEHAVHDILEHFKHGAEKKRVFYGRYPVPVRCRRRLSDLPHAQYRTNGGIIGFETHKGCSSSCVYCLEARTRVTFREPVDVISEIRTFVDAG